MKTATIREAQHHLSKLVDEVLETGTELILTRRGKQVCRISPVAAPPLKRVDWKQVHARIDQRLQGIPPIGHDIAARMRVEERF